MLIHNSLQNPNQIKCIERNLDDCDQLQVRRGNLTSRGCSTAFYKRSWFKVTSTNNIFILHSSGHAQTFAYKNTKSVDYLTAFVF